MKNHKLLLVILLSTVTAFSVFKYVFIAKEKQDLLGALQEIKTQVNALENEKDTLLKELETEKGLKDEFAQKLKVSEDKITELDAGLADMQNTIEGLNSRISALKAENDAVRGEKERVALELAEACEERDSLKARFNSVAELKKAIKELRKRVHKAKKEAKGKIRYKQEFIDGNRGYIIQDGKPTYPAKVKIEVTPVSGPES